MPSVFLDLRTLSIILTLISAILGVLLILIWRTNKTYPGFGFWLVSNLPITAGLLLLSLRGVAPDLVTTIIANDLTFAGILISTYGNRKFLGLADGKEFIIALFALYASALQYLRYLNAPASYWIITISLFSVINGGLVTFDFGRAWLKEKNSTYKLVSVIYLLYSCLTLLRAIFTYLFSNIRELYTPDWIQSLSFMMFIVFAVSWTFIYMILNNERLQQELKATKAEFERLATTDFLTGTNNNRRFYELGNVEINRARRFRHSMTLIMFDIDHFKRINDTYGHDAGDRVLIAVADICNFNLREQDILGRLGGEEFGVILPYTKIDVGKTIAERLRRAFAETDIVLPSETIKVTASFGLTELCKEDTQLKDLLNRADAALYEAKQSGRNQVKTSALISQTSPTNFSKIDLPQMI